MKEGKSMNSTIAFEIVLAAVTFALGVTIGPRLTRRFDSWWDKRSNVSRSKSAKRLREEYAHCRQLNRRPTLFYLESFRSIAEILFLIAFGVFIAVEVASSVPLLITPSFFTGPSILQWLDSSNHDPILARILVYFSVGLGLILLLAIIRLTDTVTTN